MNKECDLHKLPENKEEYEAWMNKMASQERESNSTGKITCLCNIAYEFRYLYRCYFCGLWLCPVCAKKHFGKRPNGKYTYKDYFKEDNNEKN